MERERIKTINFDISLERESFQNEILRPILKALNNHLLTLGNNIINSRNKNFLNLSKQKKMETIDSLFNKDNNFRNTIKGLILGNLDVNELEIFLAHEKEMTKRALQMAKERFISQSF